MPKKVRLLSVTIIVILLLSTLSLSEAFAGGGSRVYDLNKYPLDEGPSTVGDRYSISIGPGGSYSNSGSVNCVFPCDGDTYVVTVTSNTYIRIMVSPSTEGEWICWGAPYHKYECATPPANVTVVGTRGPGTYYFHIWAIEPTESFPADYTITVTGSNPLSPSQGRPTISSHTGPTISAKTH